MTKLIAVMMALVMILTLPASSFAAEATDAPDAEIKTNREYAFTYTEYTDALTISPSIYCHFSDGARGGHWIGCQ